MTSFYTKLLMKDRLAKYLPKIDAKVKKTEINLINCMKTKNLKVNDHEYKE